MRGVASTLWFVRGFAGGLRVCVRVCGRVCGRPKQQQCYDPWSQVSSAPTLLRAYQTGAQIGHGDASVGCSVHIASVNRCADTACMRASGESVEVWMSTRHAAQQHIVRHRPHPVSISHHPLPRASPDVCVKRPTAQQDMQVACNAVAQCHEAFNFLSRTILTTHPFNHTHTRTALSDIFARARSRSSSLGVVCRSRCQRAGVRARGVGPARPGAADRAALYAARPPAPDPRRPGLTPHRRRVLL
eukprot:1966125-Rhodomonas_salina.1